MATGMPCIVSRCSAPREYFDKKYGWWVEMSELYSPVSQCFPGITGLWRLPDVNSLADVMRYAYEHRNECKEKGRLASEYVLSDMTWERGVQPIVDYVRSII
jgi:glycosyltransferase involved in cell wall biosynthesis